MTTAWSRAHVAALRVTDIDQLPLIREADVVPVADDIDIWDSWPIRTPDGAVADVCGGEVWVALAAPYDEDPARRHDVAAHRAFLRRGDGWVDLGDVFAPGDALGSRQWAGATVLDGDRIVAYYTAAGVAGSDPPGFRQRPAAATATLRCTDGLPEFREWSPHAEVLQPDPDRYDVADQLVGEPGYIKAFRDPSPFVDPTTGVTYLLVTGSIPPVHSHTDFNGAIGIARRTGDGIADWEVLDPLVTADGVNNELERPHMVFRDGRFHLFFSTQSRTFHPDVVAPTGLYGFVADDLFGPYEPLNGHGCVFMNPLERPFQAYSWLVLDDLRVVGFVDAPGVEATGDVLTVDGLDDRRALFGGTFSPTVRVAIDGARAGLAIAS